MEVGLSQAVFGAGRFAHPALHGGIVAPVITFAFFLMVAALVALVVAAIVRKPKSPQPQLSPLDASLEIVRGRLARGEIDPEQYRAIVRALNNEYATDATPPTA